MTSLKIRFGASLTAMFLYGSLNILSAASVLTQHNDLSRTGSNLNEIRLNTTNVNPLLFGKISSHPVDGQMYAQVLYAAGLVVPGKGTLNVIYAATEHNSVYAYDADSSASAPPLWRVNFGAPILCTQIAGCDRDLLPEIGITSTPVIDLPSSTIYVVAETFEGGRAYFRLHALDLATGAEKSNSPVTIGAVVASDGAASSGGRLAFDAYMHWQRAALLLYNKTVYIGFGSHQDTQPYHGWLFAYNSATLQQSAVQCLSPHTDSSGVWQSGAAPAVDADGNIYVQTGHGALSGMSGGDFGISMVKLRSSDLKPLDFFSPSNQKALSDDDNDFGSGGPLLIPGTPYAVGGGKDGKVFLIDTANMGHYDALQNHVPQFFQATYSLLDTGAGGLFGGNVWLNNTLYLWGRRDVLKAFRWDGSRFQTTPSSSSSYAVPDGYSSEPALAASANGTVPGTGILWAVTPDYGSSDGRLYPGTLRAYDSANVGRELWNSGLNPQDRLGSWSKWVAPTIANGHVYVATFDGFVQVYGLSPTAAQIQAVEVKSSNGPVSLTKNGTADWIHWGDTAPVRKAGVIAQISPMQPIGRAPQPYTTDPHSLSWSDGMGIAMANGNTNGVIIYGIGLGYGFTVPADKQMRVLTVHAGGSNSAGKLTAHLSDGSAPDLVDTFNGVTGSYVRDYVLKYQAASPGQTLQISWVQTTRAGSVSLSAATLASGILQGLPSSASAVNLTAEGTIDWMHWGDGAVIRKGSAAPVIGDLTPISNGSPVFTYNNDLRAIDWSDGATAASSTGNRNGVFISGTGNGFSLTVPASQAQSVLRIHVGGWNSSARMTVTMSDGSAAPYTEDVSYFGGQYVRDYQLKYRAALPGQSITVTWLMTGGGGNVTWSAASLQN